MQNGKYKMQNANFKAVKTKLSNLWTPLGFNIAVYFRHFICFTLQLKRSFTREGGEYNIMKMSKRSLIWGVVLFVFLSAGLARAQEPDREKAAKLMEDIRLARILNTIDFSEEQLVGFLPKWKEQRELRESWVKESQEIVAELKKLLEAKPVSSRKLKDVLDQLDKTQANFESKRKALKAQIDEILTTEQRAKWVVLQGQFDKEIRQLVRGLKEKRKMFLREETPQLREEP